MRTTNHIHKAEPAPEFAEDAVSTCIHCHRDIKRVPGGHGPTWVHADTGAVAGRGGEHQFTQPAPPALTENRLPGPPSLAVLWRRQASDAAVGHRPCVPAVREALGRAPRPAGAHQPRAPRLTRRARLV